MSYDNAKRALNENLQIIDVKQDPALYNLSSALLNIVDQLGRDIRTINKNIRDVEDLVKRLQ